MTSSRLTSARARNSTTTPRSTWRAFASTPLPRHTRRAHQRRLSHRRGRAADRTAEAQLSGVARRARPAGGQAPVMEFEGKAAMVTGAASGIGRACALEFAQGGADVVLVDVAGEVAL